MSSNGHHGSVTHGASRKRKDREDFDSPRATQVEPSLDPASAAQPANNRLLAGYLAHEFLTQGTLLGQKWNQARPALPSKPNPKAEPAQSELDRPKAYADVAQILKKDGVHIPGIVNPTQLARWIQM